MKKILSAFLVTAASLCTDAHAQTTANTLQVPPTALQQSISPPSPKQTVDGHAGIASGSIDIQEWLQDRAHQQQIEKIAESWFPRLGDIYKDYGARYLVGKVVIRSSADGSDQKPIFSQPLMPGWTGPEAYMLSLGADTPFKDIGAPAGYSDETIYLSLRRMNDGTINWGYADYHPPGDPEATAEKKYSVLEDAKKHFYENIDDFARQAVVSNPGMHKTIDDAVSKTSGILIYSNPPTTRYFAVDATIWLPSEKPISPSGTVTMDIFANGFFDADPKTPENKILNPAIIDFNEGGGVFVQRILVRAYVVPGTRNITWELKPRAELPGELVRVPRIIDEMASDYIKHEAAYQKSKSSSSTPAPARPSGQAKVMRGPDGSTSTMPFFGGSFGGGGGSSGSCGMTCLEHDLN